MYAVILVGTMIVIHMAHCNNQRKNFRGKNTNQSLEMNYYLLESGEQSIKREKELDK